MLAKLETCPGIYLVGFMGSGKSTVGRMLAHRLGWDFVDLDDEIEKRAAATIPEIFEKLGEPAFREMERSTLLGQVSHVSDGRSRVVALGGGAFVSEGNRKALAAAGVSIWLDCPMGRLWARVSREEHRPLARNRVAFAALYRERREQYAHADFAVEDEGDGPEAVVEKVLALVVVERGP